MTTFKKLDEYLKDADYSIVNALSAAMHIKPSRANELLQNIDIRQETELVHILDDDMTSNDEKTQLVHDFFQELGLMEDENHFNGVDIIGDYNYKCMIVDSASRDVYMDWLEEHSYEYLIDHSGRFAVKCNNRDMTYKAERASDACKKKVWLKDAIIKNVDPTERRKGMPTVKRAALTDSASLEHSPFDTFKDRSSSASPFTDNTLDDEEFEEGKKPSKRAIKKKNDARLHNSAKTIAGGENPAKSLSDPQFRNKIVKDKNKYNKKKERQAKIIDESIIIEDVKVVTGAIDTSPITRLMVLAGMSTDNPVITESLSDAISDLAMEVVDGADVNTIANEIADEYGINAELLLRKFEEQHTSVETLRNAEKNKAMPSSRIDNAIKKAREYFTKHFVGEPDEEVGKIFKFKTVEYAYIAYDGKKIIGTRVDGVSGKEIWNFSGPKTVNSIVSQIRG